MPITDFLQCPDIFQCPYENQSYWFLSYSFLSWVSEFGLLFSRNICLVFLHYAACTVVNTFFSRTAVFTAFRVKWDCARWRCSFDNVSFPEKTPPWYFQHWSQGSVCVVFVRCDFAIYKVRGRLLTVTSLLLVLSGDLQAWFFPWDEYLFKRNMHFSTRGHMHGDYDLIWAVRCLPGYLSLDDRCARKGNMCTYR